MLDRLLASKSLILANRCAPVLSCLILTCYALSGKRLSIVLGGSEPGEQKAIVASAVQFRANSQDRWRSFLFGGG